MIHFLIHNITKLILLTYYYLKYILNFFKKIFYNVTKGISKKVYKLCFVIIIYLYKIIRFIFILPSNLPYYVYVGFFSLINIIKFIFYYLFVDKDKFIQKTKGLLEKPEKNEIKITINKKGGNRNSLMGAFKTLYMQKKAFKSIVIRDIKSEFIQTRLGPIWFFIMPFIQSTVFYVVFGNVGKMPTEGSNAFFFYIFGLLVWTSYSQASINISYTLVENAGILTKVPCSPILFPFAKAGFRLLQCCINLFVFYIVYICLQGLSAFKLSLLSPLYISLGLAIVMLTALSGGLMAAALSIKKRDFLYLWSYIITALMYLTPIIYPFRALPLKWKYIAAMNPLTSGIEMVRSTMLGLPILDLKFILMGLTTLLVIILISTYFYLTRFRTAMDHL
jgi:lipopolysaccharide transport system permease protein